MLTEGRTIPKIRTILEVLTRPQEISMDAVSLLITDDMARDVKDLNFGFSDNKSYSGCHRGISPFTVVTVLSATAAKCRLELCHQECTSITYGDLPNFESSPGPLPKDFLGLLHLIRSYMALLVVVVGKKYHHYLQVKQIGLGLNKNVSEFNSLAARNLATIVWQIF
jgi:hypothetical protein